MLFQPFLALVGLVAESPTSCTLVKHGLSTSLFRVMQRRGSQSNTDWSLLAAPNKREAHNWQSVACWGSQGCNGLI